jgi:WD40 repeat protein
LPETEFVSASSDCSAIIWTRTYGCNFSPTSILKGHQNTVAVADGIYVSSRNAGSAKQAAIIATASVDSTVKIWIRHENEGNIAPRTEYKNACIQLSSHECVCFVYLGQTFLIISGTCLLCLQNLC